MQLWRPAWGTLPFPSQASRTSLQAAARGDFCTCCRAVSRPLNLHLHLHPGQTTVRPDTGRTAPSCPYNASGSKATWPLGCHFMTSLSAIPRRLQNETMSNLAPATGESRTPVLTASARGPISFWLVVPRQSQAHLMAPWKNESQIYDTSDWNRGPKPAVDSLAQFGSSIFPTIQGTGLSSRRQSRTSHTPICCAEICMFCYSISWRDSLAQAKTIFTLRQGADSPRGRINPSADAGGRRSRADPQNAGCGSSSGRSPRYQTLMSKGLGDGARLVFGDRAFRRWTCVIFPAAL